MVVTMNAGGDIILNGNIMGNIANSIFLYYMKNQLYIKLNGGLYKIPIKYDHCRWPGDTSRYTVTAADRFSTELKPGDKWIFGYENNEWIIYPIDWNAGRHTGAYAPGGTVGAPEWS